MYGLRRKVKTVKSRCVQASPIYITDYIYIHTIWKTKGLVSLNHIIDCHHVFGFTPCPQLHRDRDELSDGRSAAYQDEILAVCKLHGFLGIPSVEVQLQALDKEYQHLKEQGQSTKADYIQTLYVWLSKKTGTVSKINVDIFLFHRIIFITVVTWNQQ